MSTPSASTQFNTYSSNGGVTDVIGQAEPTEGEGFGRCLLGWSLVDASSRWVAKLANGIHGGVI